MAEITSDLKNQEHMSQEIWSFEGENEDERKTTHGAIPHEVSQAGSWRQKRKRWSLTGVLAQLPFWHVRNVS